MTLTLRKVEQDHLRPLFLLEVAEGQQDLVARNEFTLAQQAYEVGSYVWSIFADDTIVGLIAMVHPRQSDDMEEDDDLDAAYIWRLMIGAEFQGNGYGKEAVNEACKIARSWDCPRICLTFVDKPGGPEPFYEKLGFVRTGRISDGEIEMKRDA